MGLFDFVKNAGASVFGKDDSPAKAAPQPQTHTVSPAELDAMKRRKALEKLLGDDESRKKLMAELGIDTGEG